MDDHSPSPEGSHNAERLRRLFAVALQVAGMHDLPSLMATIRRATRELVGADGVTLILRDGDLCHYVDEDAIEPLWKGQRFPLDACVSGLAMLERRTIVIEDVFEDSRVPHAAYQPTFVRGLSIVPIGRADPVGAIGCYWQTPHHATRSELETQQMLAEAMSVGLATVALEEKLQDARRSAEQAAAAATESERQLQTRNDMLREAQRLAGLGNWIWRIERNECLWSEEVFRLHGLPPGSPVPPYPECLHLFAAESRAEVEQTMQRAIATGEPQECDGEIVRPDGTRCWLTLRVNAHRDGSGRVVELSGTVLDITERRRSAETLRALNATLEQRVAQRTAALTAMNEELDSFAYAVSHDLRAPLRAMSGFSAALIEDYGDRLSGHARSYLEQIDLASRRMGELINALLALSRSTRGDVQRQTIDVSELAARILAEYAGEGSERQITVEIECGLTLNGDAAMVEALLRNLLGNAWKYTARTDRPSIRVHQGAIDGRPAICVSDNGAGFDMQHAGRLFHPFHRLHRQDEFPGIGIGLATVQRIIRRHGGVIRAQSSPGQGASFCFSLTDEAGAEK